MTWGETASEEVEAGVLGEDGFSVETTGKKVVPVLLDKGEGGEEGLREGNMRENAIHNLNREGIDVHGAATATATTTARRRH